MNSYCTKNTFIEKKIRDQRTRSRVPPLSLNVRRRARRCRVRTGRKAAAAEWPRRAGATAGVGCEALISAAGALGYHSIVDLGLRSARTEGATRNVLSLVRAMPAAAR